ncbi:Holliday junction branch migration protein RuvA [Candidatus Halobeggiatoa sp. HSG11]|nr:Holliday junction branch migration protein RuvA [Candidatus Halobeggiatoa sp. HSG11]
MISSLRGIIIEKQAPLLVIEVNGVGYEISAPMSTFYNLPELNSEVKLLTHLSIRDDAHVLYGFLIASERELFRSLIRINGVGPKLALSILSSMELNAFIQCIHDNDITQLKRIPGIGKKTAERLVIEMRDYLKTDDVSIPNSKPINNLTPKSITPIEEAISALIALGYKPNDASRWVKSIAKDDMNSEDLIRRALQSAL